MSKKPQNVFLSTLKYCFLPTIFIFLFVSFIKFDFNWFLNTFLSKEKEGNMLRTTILIIEMISFAIVYSYLYQKDVKINNNG